MYGILSKAFTPKRGGLLHYICTKIWAMKNGGVIKKTHAIGFRMHTPLGTCERIYQSLHLYQYVDYSIRGPLDPQTTKTDDEHVIIVHE